LLVLQFLPVKNYLRNVQQPSNLGFVRICNVTNHII
jgi:hypothetical protein